MNAEERAPQNRATDVGHAEGEVGGRRRRGNPRRSAILIVVSLVNVALLALLLSQLLTPAQNQSNTGGSQGISPLLGHSAPDFTLPSLSPHPVPDVRLARLKGKPVVLNFWASWCVPCQQEAPALEATWQQSQPRGVIFLGVDFQDTQTNGLDFLRQYRITYPNVLDATGATAISYGVTGVPETVFIDRHGVIVQKVIGPLSASTLQSALDLISR